MKKEYKDRRIKVNRFPVSIFIATFVAIAILVTVQNKILSEYIDSSTIPSSYIVGTVIYWFITSAGVAFFTRRQIAKRYDEPLKQFAAVTKEVANGDFSVYVRPLHSTNKMDYLDVMMEDFNKMVAELGSIETLKTEFFSNVSHEIKTPLAVIQNYAELMQSDNLTNEQRKEYVSFIMQSTKKLSGLITNILKLNKLEQQKISPTPQPYDVCAQLFECAMLYENVWEEKEIEFIADMEDRVTIEADESLLALVWNNLLSNAMKFTGKCGQVTLKQTSTKDEIFVSVSDTGCGISEDTMRHIFDKFYQGDTSHATEGNGLGLALTLRVIQLSGGTITAKSELGKGSEFMVMIPISCYKNEDGIQI